MSSAFFRTETHLVDSSHIRQYPHALIDEQEDVLQLAVKQYTPLNNLSPHPGDVTIIAAHANGVGKELYEPLWDELLNLSVRSNAFRIRNIWMADVAWQGESGVLNEHKLGNDREYLSIIAHVQSLTRLSVMVRPSQRSYAFCQYFSQTLALADCWRGS